jgi:hypothetical protein
MNSIGSILQRVASRRTALIPAFLVALALLLGAGAVVVRAQEAKADDKKAAEKKAPHQSQCESCHVGIESMHANKSDIACVDCHGGNDTSTSKEAAHVQPRKGSVFANGARPGDSYSYLNLESTEFVRFLNPSDLRVAEKSCGDCHGDIVKSVRTSIMATNTMAHGAVFYNNGAIGSKVPIYGEAYDEKSRPAAQFPDPPPTREAQDRGALPQLHPHPQFDVTKITDPLRIAEVNNPELGDRGPGTGGRIAAVYLNVLKTRLNDPTLWFLGVNKNGGDFRGSGCSGCHIIYANSRDEASGEYAQFGNKALSASADPAIHGKAGFPIKHQLTQVIPAMQCLTCHYHQGNGALDTYIGAVWWDRESDADFIKKYKGEDEYGPGQMSIWDHNSEAKNTQFEDYHAHGWNIMKIYKRDEKGLLLDAKNNIVPDSDPDKFKKAVHLKDIHFEKGLDCIDCHTEQDVHGDGNLYAQMTDAIEIRCEDCHGSVEKRATLLTSGMGQSGGHKLKKVDTPFGGKQFEVNDAGQIIEHSMKDPNRSWVVKQVVDVINPASPDYNPRAAYAKLVLRTGAIGSGTSGQEALAHSNSKIMCFTCHSSWQTTCSGCHLPLDVNVKSRDIHYDPQFSKAFAPYWRQVIRTDLYFFGIGTYNQGKTVWPFRPASSTIVSAKDGDRNNIVHQQPLVSTPGFSNEAMTPHPPHTVRTTETKQCADCHVSEDNSNNARIASSLGFGVNALNFLGEFAYIAENGHSITAVKVTEGDEPQPVIGSNFDKVLYPESYAKFEKGGRKLTTSHRRLAPKIVGLAMRGEYVITAEGSAGFKLYDVANINNKQFAQRIVQHVNSPLGEGSVVHSPDATSIYFPSSSPMSLDRTGMPENMEQRIHELYRYAFATDRKDGFMLIDVNTLTDADPENNVLRAKVRFNPDGQLTGAVKVRPWGHYAYVVSEQTGLSVIDINNPLSPRLAYHSAPGELDGARAVEVQLRYAFVLDRSGMKTFDITNPEQPRLIPGAAVAMPDARGLTIFRTKALVAAGKQGLAIIDVANPEHPGAPQIFDAGGKLNDSYDVQVAETNVSYFAYVADGKNGMQIVALIETDNPGYQGFAPDITSPRLVASFPTHGRAMAIAEPTIRDRYVDESGNQIAVTNRIGSRPFNADEIHNVLFYPDGKLLKVNNNPPTALLKPKDADTVATKR